MRVRSVRLSLTMPGTAVGAAVCANVGTAMRTAAHATALVPSTCTSGTVAAHTTTAVARLGKHRLQSCRLGRRRHRRTDVTARLLERHRVPRILSSQAESAAQLGLARFAR